MKEPDISVAIQSEKGIEFELYGDFSSPDYDKYFNGRYNAAISEGGITITNGIVSFTAEENILFEPADIDSNAFLLHNVTIGIKFHWEQRENQKFAGSLKLIKEGDKITAVNILPIEHYLASVISSEMNPESSIELLKAHAIISRSWILAQIEKRKFLQSAPDKYESTKESKDELIKWYDREDHILYDVCADDHCQRYQGITKIFIQETQNAVKETTGLVLKYQNSICDTRFSKSCGGISEAFENVWEPVKHPYLTSVIDYKFEPDIYDLDLTREKSADKWIRNKPQAFCNTSDEAILSQVLLDYDRKTTDFYRWEKEYSQEELAGIIREKSGIDFGNIIDLVPVERGYSGRLIKLKIIGTKKSLTVGKELEIRRLLSTSHLYSSAFVVDKSGVEENIPQKFKLTGAGWGHGVGLCQIGAAVMSEMGYAFDEILLHYFRYAKIEKIY